MHRLLPFFLASLVVSLVILVVAKLSELEAERVIFSSIEEDSQQAKRSTGKMASDEKTSAHVGNIQDASSSKKDGMISSTADTSQGISKILIVTPEWPGATSADGSGYYFELIKAIYQPLGIQVTYDLVPWRRAYLLIEEKQADFMLGVYDEAEAKRVCFLPKNALDLEVTSVLFHKKFSQWKGFESLTNKNIAYIRGYEYISALNIAATEIEISASKQAKSLLDSQRADYYMDANWDLHRMLGEYPEQEVKNYRIEPVVEKKTYSCFAQTKRSEKLIEIYDQRMYELQVTGELAALLKKYERENYNLLAE